MNEAVPAAPVSAESMAKQGCEKLGLDLAEVEAAFAPYCTSVQEIVTAESFADVSAG